MCRSRIICFSGFHRADVDTEPLRLQVRTLQPQGVQSWWQPGHPGWAIYPVDSDHFLSTGVLDQVSVNTESISAPPPTGSPGVPDVESALSWKTVSRL